MATSYGYDHPTYTVQRQAMVTGDAGTTTGGRFRHYGDITLTGVQLVVVTAGTLDASAYKIQEGAAAIGTATIGTNTAGATVSLDVTNTVIDSLAALVAVKVGDETGVADIVYEYTVNYGAESSS